MSQESNYNTVARSTLQHFKKPAGKEVGDLQLFRNTKIEKITPSELGEAVTNGYSFHPGIPKFQKGLYSFRDEHIAFQNIFAVDIDHHSYTVEELLKRCPVEPNLIYTTHSYTEANKRYRVVFFANSTLKSKKAITKVNTILTATFLEGLDREVLAFSDLSAINPARLFFGGREVVYQNDHARFNLDDLFQNQELVDRAMKTWAIAEHETSEHQARIRGIKKLSDYVGERDWKKFSELEKEKTPEAYHFMIQLAKKLDEQGLAIKGDKVLKPASQRKPKSGKGAPKEPKPKCQPGERPIYKEKIDLALERLADYRQAEPAYLDYKDAMAHLNQLPLHELFDETLDEHVVSYLRNEEHPSAMFFKTKKGHIVYYDYATKETLSLISLLSEMMTIEYGTTKTQNIETMLEKLNIKMWSSYKCQAVQQIMMGRDLFLDLLQGEQPHEAKSLMKYGVGHTYVAICNLLSRYIPNDSLLEGRPGVVVYRSLEQFHQDLLSGFYGDVSMMQIKGYDTFVRKVNYLCVLGFLVKVDPEELSAGVKTGLKDHKNKWLAAGLEEKDYKTPNFYEFIPVTSELLTEALRRKAYLDSKGITLRTLRQKHVAAVSTELAQPSYQKPKPAYDQSEAKFINLCVKQGKRLLKAQHYFTEEQLLDRMLQNDKWYNGTKKTTPKEVELDPVDKETNTRIERSNAKLGLQRKIKTFNDLQAPILAQTNSNRVKVRDAPQSLKIPKGIHRNKFIYVSNEVLN